jgi:hypothetical protein
MNTAFQTALEQVAEADRAFYSDAVKLRNLLESKGVKINTGQAASLTGATLAGLRARLKFSQDGLSHMQDTSESPTKRMITAKYEWAITCIETELGRREALAVAAE